MDCGMINHLIHVSGKRIIAQGTNGFPQGFFMEREMVGKDMTSFVDSGKDAAEGHPLAGLDLLLDRPILVTTSYLAGWYNEGHGITDGYDDNHGVWITTHGPSN